MDSESYGIQQKIQDKVPNPRLNQLSKNKALLSRMSDALKKHEKIVEPIIQLIAKAVTTSLGLDI